LRLLSIATALCALGPPLGSAAAEAVPTVPAIGVPEAGGDPWSADGVAALGKDLDALFEGAPALRGAHAGFLALDTATGEVLYSRHADDEFQPASTLKLVVGSAALERLGPAYHFHTQLSLLAAGTGVAPVLELAAGGDPLLSHADLGDAANAVAAAGVRAVSGVTIDVSHFDDTPYPAGWTWDDFRYDYAARSNALVLDENTVPVTVEPGPAAGAPAVVDVPASACAHSDARTVAAGAAAALDLGAGAGTCIEVVGSIALGAPPQTLDAAMPDPLLDAQDVLRAELSARGVTSTVAPLATGTSGGVQPSGPPLWTHESAPLGDWIGPRFWIPSDNLVGETLLKELGFISGGKPGTTAKGIGFEMSWLQSIGINPATVTLADGCGMSQYDRITPRDLVTILQHDWNGPQRRLVLDSLPIGGVRGTIEGIAGTPASGRVFAKTGSMMHVRGLAGYLATQRHGAVTFAFNVDDWNGVYPELAALRARVLSRIVSD
jgi:D-alanyl-D-alanine carboxypeptidase/D-alanyl-D-alanine-endopeptidase (penicillin-binding protein 4)